MKSALPIENRSDCQLLSDVDESRVPSRSWSGKGSVDLMMELRDWKKSGQTVEILKILRHEVARETRRSQRRKWRVLSCFEDTVRKVVGVDQRRKLGD